MKVCLLLERGSPPRRNRVIEETMSLLQQRGVGVRVLHPEEELVRLDRLAVEADLYLDKSHTELALSLATALERLGARVVNSAAASTRVMDKVLAASALLRAGLPTPRSLVAGEPAQLAPQLSDGPLMLKPHRGHYGVGMRVVDTPAELPAPDTYPDVVFAQDYLAQARADLKIYAIGDDVFGVRRFFPADSFCPVGEPTPLSPRLEELARECGRAFGLELYGLQIAEENHGAYVVDVNSFPGYDGVPDAARRLADYVQQAARA